MRPSRYSGGADAHNILCSINSEVSDQIELLARQLLPAPAASNSTPRGPRCRTGASPGTNAQLLNRVRAAARHLQDLGIGPGDVVALKLTNRVEFVLLLFAAWRLGATVTPVNPSMTDVEVTRQLSDSGARLLVIEDGAAVAAGLATLSVGELSKRRRGGTGRRVRTRPRRRFSSTAAVRPGRPRV